MLIGQLSIYAEKHADMLMQNKGIFRKLFKAYNFAFLTDWEQQNV